MKILQICPKVPFSPKDGGSLAMNILTEGLISQGNIVHVLAISTPQYFIKEETIEVDYRNKTNYQSVYIDTSVKAFPAFLNLFSSKSYNVIRFYSKEFEEALIQRLSSEQYDVIQLESIFVTPYLATIRKHSTAKVILRSHNVEFMIWERLTKNTESGFKRMYLNFLFKRLKKYELGLLNKYDAIATITELDAMIYKKEGCVLPMITIPFGIDVEKYKIDNSKIEKFSLFHLGAMDWRPNIDGITWFLKNSWMKIVAKHPSAKLYLAGRNMPDELYKLNVSGSESLSNVTIEGEITNAHRFINSKSIMIVPLQSGGGMRVKIIEGMALSKAIVSTTIGAEGIDCESKKNILIADSEQEFIDAIDKCLSDSEFSEMIGKNARRLVETKYDNQLISNKLSDFYKSLLN